MFSVNYTHSVPVIDKVDHCSHFLVVSDGKEDRQYTDDNLWKKDFRDVYWLVDLFRNQTLFKNTYFENLKVFHHFWKAWAPKKICLDLTISASPLGSRERLNLSWLTDFFSKILSIEVQYAVHPGNTTDIADDASPVPEKRELLQDAH